MAKGKKSFVLYSDQQELFEALTDEQAGKLIKHIFKYVNDENPVLDDALLSVAFVPIKQQLKRDLQAWEKQRNQRVEAGKKSAESRQRNSTSVNERSRTSTVNVNDNVNVNVNDNVKDKKEIKGVPPAFELFINHCRKKAKDLNITLDEEKATNKFNAWLENDWCDLNGKKILNWKVKITTNITYWQKPKQSNDNFELKVYS
jgi:hypothetical protein